MESMKRLSLMTLALLLAVNGFAQQPVGTWSVLPKIGVSIAKITGDSFYNELGKMDASYKTGVTCGVETEYQAFERVAFSAGLFYAQEGEHFKNFSVETKTGGYGVSNSDISLDYLKMPILASLYIDHGLSFKLGVQPGYLIHNKVAYDEVSYTIDEENNREYDEVVKYREHIGSDFLKKFQFSIPVALSYEYMNVVLDARYAFSLTKPMKAPLNDNGRNSVFTFTVGYRFAL